MDTITILGLQVSRTDALGMFEQVGAWSRREGPRTILYLNAHCANLAEGDPAYKAILNQADLVFADGVSVVWAARLLRGVELQ